MNPREFLVVANRLAATGSAGDIRSAISRAYYSAFHVGADTLRALGFTVSRGGAGHGEVARCFSNSGDHQVKVAGDKLADLHGIRNRADYQLNRTDIEQPISGTNATTQAQSLITTFDGILASPQRPQIQSAIAGWRKSNGYP